MSPAPAEPGLRVHGAVTPAFVPGIPAKNPHPSPGTVQGGPWEMMAGAGFFFRTILEDPEHFSGSPKGKRPWPPHSRAPGENAGNINNKNPSRQIERYARTMFFFFHLVTGIILGFLIADLLHDRRWIVPCVIGAVLPDIVDKPLNYILLPAVSGNGRFLFHNLVVFAILLVAGLLLWKYYRSPLVLALDTGILSHQILDSMWTEPVRWLYPLLGPYPAQAVQPPDYLFDLLLTDLYNPVEWVLIILCTCVLVLYWQRGPLAAAAGTPQKSFRHAPEVRRDHALGLLRGRARLRFPENLPDRSCQRRRAGCLHRCGDRARRDPHGPVGGSSEKRHPRAGTTGSCLREPRTVSRSHGDRAHGIPCPADRERPDRILILLGKGDCRGVPAGWRPKQPCR